MLVKLQRAEVRCSIETLLPPELRVKNPQGLQRAEVRCSIETISPRGSAGCWRVRCSARKCAALLRRRYWATARRIALALQRAEVRCSIETP